MPRCAASPRRLTERGYRALEAADAASALALLEREPVDLLFSDVAMPGGMNGHEVTALVAELLG